MKKRLRKKQQKKQILIRDICYNEFCFKANHGKPCEHYIEWYLDYGGWCYSCKLIGQSENIIECPDDCPFKQKRKRYEKKEISKILKAYRDEDYIDEKFRRRY